MPMMSEVKWRRARENASDVRGREIRKRDSTMKKETRGTWPTLPPAERTGGTKRPSYESCSIV